jgi:hypothetical protein
LSCMLFGLQEVALPSIEAQRQRAGWLLHMGTQQLAGVPCCCLYGAVLVHRPLLLLRAPCSAY